MSKQERGQTSRESELNEDEKPLKKARFVWEVKGKYHLKEAYKNNNNNSSDSESNKKQVDECEISQIANKNIEKCAKTDHHSCCCIKSILATADLIMDNDSDVELPNKNKTAESSSNSNDIPLSLVSERPKNQDYYLQKWQARQIARGFVDNTINSVLETWSNPPFNAVDFVENCDNDGQVEDDAILMAIQSHGLSSSRGGNLQLPNRRPPDTTTATTTPLPSSGLEQFREDNAKNNYKERNHQRNNAGDTTSCDSSDHSNANNLEGEDAVDFLNAAVSAAIKKKGLSYGF